MRSLNLPEGPKAKLVQYYDNQAAACYRKVVLEHAAAPHVEDAKDRLAAMNLPIPTPTAAQLAASVELENSRGSYHLTDNVRLFFLHTPDTVVAAHSGDPTLTDPKATVAPMVVKRANEEFRAALLPDAAAPAAPAASASAAPAAAPVDTTPAPAAAPLSFGEVPTAGTSSSPSTSVMTAPAASTPTSGNSVGVEIINPKSANPVVPAPPNPSPDDIVKPVGPTNTTSLPPVEKAADAPDTPNTINGQTNAAGTPNPNGKTAATPVDKKDESSSKKKPKKGLEKLIPPL
jgi:outer membrane protein assembly factor BamD